MLQIIVALIVSITALIVVSRYLKLHPFFSLILASLLFGTLMGKPILEIFTSMQAGFGSLLQQIGFLVAIGSCLGIVLERTGAMTTIGSKIIFAFGPKKTVLAMSMIGVLVGIPVFCDSGFIILSRLIPALSASGANPAQLSLALSSGLYTSHTLVAPTPGPLAAAANLGVASNLGIVILIGLIGSIPVALVSYLLSKRLGANITTTQSTQAEIPLGKHSFLLAILPLIMPIILIASGSLAHLIPTLTSGVSVLQIIGNPSIALLIGLLISTLLISKSQKTEWPGWISEALKDAGIILLITGAGGAFGGVIKSSGVDVILKQYMATSEAGGIIFLLIGFVLAAILKTAQGSSTSAIIITSSLLIPLTATAGFVSVVDISILILAIGGGAMTVSHANDSYFWVVSQFSGISERDAYRSYTLVTLAQGLTALGTAMLLFIVL
jgi:gluconate:H+ symporter, GntP family